MCSEEDVDLGWTNFFIDFLQTTNETLNAAIPSPYIMTPLNCHTEEEESKFNNFEIQVLKYPYTILLVTLEPEDKAMIAVIAFFGTLLLIGTLADTILNIMHLDIVPDSLLKVNNEFSIMYHNYKSFISDLSRVFCLQ